jgi:hypothetical protein
MPVPPKLRLRVIGRANGRCEYCGLSSLGQAATFHIDHIIPQAAGGMTHFDNLALACIHCSLRKCARQRVRDPRSGKMAPIFHPRQHHWNLHFRWVGLRLIGITPTGRATIEALGLNTPDHLIIRGFEKKLGRHPPPGHA